MKVSKSLAPLFLCLATAVAVPAYANSDDEKNSDSKFTITVTPNKEDDKTEKKEVYEANLKDLLKKGKKPIDAHKIVEFYQNRVIHLNSPVNASAADRIIHEMKVLDELNPGEPIHLMINSPGGDVYEGLRIYNTMMTLQSPTHTVCNGMAASMAAVLTIAGEERSAMPGCRIMIHEASAGTRGKTSDMAYDLQHFKNVEASLFKIIAEHSGLDIDDVKKIGKAEVFYDPQQSARLGFVDEVVKSLHGPDNTKEKRKVPQDLMPENVLRQMFSPS